MTNQRPLDKELTEKQCNRGEHYFPSTQSGLLPCEFCGVEKQHNPHYTDMKKETIKHDDGTFHVVAETNLEQLAIDEYGSNVNLFGQQRDGFVKGYQKALEEKWIDERLHKPKFGVPVFVRCRIYGRAIYTYENLDPENPKCKWGNWHDGKELGVLPPTHWMELPAFPNPKENA